MVEKSNCLKKRKTRDQSTCGEAGALPNLPQIKPSQPETGKQQKKPALACGNSLLQNDTEAWDCLKCLQQMIFLYIAGY